MELCTPFKRNMLTVVIFLFIGQFLVAFFPIVLGKMFTALGNNDKKSFLFAIMFWVLIGLARSSVSFFRERFELKNLDYEISRHLSSISLEKFFGISIGQHQSGHSLIKKSIISKGETAIAQVVNISIYDLIPIGFSIAIPTFMLLVNVPLVGLSLSVFMAVFVIFTIKYTSKFVPKLRKLDSMNNSFGKKHGEFIQNVSTVIVNSQEERVMKELDNDMVSIGDKSAPVWLSFLSFFYTGQWMLIAIHASCIGMAGYLAFNGKIQTGMFVSVIFWIGQGLGTLTNISHIQRSLSKHFPQIEKYFKLLDYQSDILMPKNPVLMGELNGRIEFRNVMFRYTPRKDTDRFNDEEGKEEGSVADCEKTHTIKGVSFTLEAGKRYAFVGKSGAGKSTLVGLMLRAFDTETGHVLVDGVDIRMLDYVELRKNIGLVPQDVSLFDGTLRYNITFGLNGSAKNVTDEEMNRIGRLSRVSEFLDGLEKGWDTMIGERGIKLSGGQKQRVGIARALIKSPKILIFDEATSSLDTENEGKIRDSIREASVGRTTIIIAHRLATVRDADEILVFNEGELVGKGTHEQLLKDNVHYQRLVNSQVIMG